MLPTVLCVRVSVCVWVWAQDIRVFLHILILQKGSKTRANTSRTDIDVFKLRQQQQLSATVGHVNTFAEKGKQGGRGTGVEKGAQLLAAN